MADKRPSLYETTKSRPELGVGTIITLEKRFQVTGHLGEGGMGKVVRAFDPLMNRSVALKVMKADVPESEQRRFRLEARLLGSFSHPNLVRVLDVGTTQEHDLYWFAMELLEGRDIRGAMAGGRTVPLHVVCEIFRQVLDALHYVHLRKIVHRDVKPANVFVTHDPHDPQFRPVKLLDFGVAKDLSDPAETDGEWIVGDPLYMAPEQTRPNQAIDHRADLYALGMSFYEAITGHHPFEDTFDQAPRALLKCHRERTPMLPSTFLSQGLLPDVTDGVDAFFEHACAKNAADRFPDARAMQRAMAQIAGSLERA